MYIINSRGRAKFNMHCTQLGQKTLKIRLIFVISIRILPFKLKLQTGIHECDSGSVEMAAMETCY